MKHRIAERTGTARHGAVWAAPRCRAAAVLALLGALALPVPAPAQSEPSAPAPVNVFDLPELAAGVSGALNLMQEGQAQAAAASLRALLARFPADGSVLGLLVLAEAARGAPREAADALERLARTDPGAAARLAALPRIAPLAGGLDLDLDPDAAPPGPQPVPTAPAIPDLNTMTATVSEANTHWVPGDGGHFISRFRIPPVLSRRPVLGRDEALAAVIPFLNRWYAEGTAAGLAGDLYDNRDRGHSALRKDLFLQLLHVGYGAQARARNLDYGPNRLMGYDRITFGNSSTAIAGGPYWRSQARRLLTEPGGPAALARQYAANQIYVYPERADHDPQNGDLMPANTPFFIVSQGDSYSDQPFLRAIGVILAALRPAVKEKLAAEGLIAPMVQRLLRATYGPVTGEADYLGPLAHPSVFDGARIDYARLVMAARALSPDTIPPVVRLSVLRETPVRAGRDYFAPPLGERLFDTPFAVARLFRGTPAQRRMTVSAAATRDPNDRALRFRWVLLRGDPARVSITPHGEDGAVADIVIGWHGEARPVPGSPDLASRRVDIAVFADNGAEISAPGFVSMAFPPDQIRAYDAAGRILSVDYASPDAPRYADPALYPRRNWRDEYHYDEAGRLTGWTRIRGGATTAFTPQGEKVVQVDAAGAVLASVPLRYEAGPRGSDGRVGIVEVEAAR